MCVLICITVFLSTIAGTMTIKKQGSLKAKFSGQVGFLPPSHHTQLPSQSQNVLPKQTETTSHHFLFLPFFPPTGTRVGGRQAKEVKLSWIRKALHIYSSFPQHFLHTRQLAGFRFIICISSQNNPQAHLQNSGHSPSSTIYSFPNFATIFKALLPSPPLLLCLLTLP